MAEVVANAYSTYHGLELLYIQYSMHCYLYHACRRTSSADRGKPEVRASESWSATVAPLHLLGQEACKACGAVGGPRIVAWLLPARSITLAFFWGVHALAETDLVIP